MAKKVIMPKFGMDQEEGTVAAWLRQEGDPVQKGDPILEVETDKVNMEVEAPASGILQGIRIGPGVTAPIGQVIAYILALGETLPEENPTQTQSNQPTQSLNLPISPSPLPAQAGSPKLTPVAEQMVELYGVDPAAIPASGPRITKSDVERHIARLLADRPSAPPAPGPTAPTSPLRAVPAARRLARELGVDLAGVQGSGPAGRIQSRDVAQAAQTQPATAPPIQPQTTPAPAAGELTIRRSLPLTGTRRPIANRLTASVQQIPQFSASVHVHMARANQIIDDIRADRREGGGPKVTVTGLLVKACAWALARHPALNASFRENAIVEWAEINVGVAVALEAGLVVPVIRNPAQRSLSEIAGELADLAERARSNSLKPADVQGGTFTISNLGMTGVESFTAIINPPQAAILAVGRILLQPVADDNGALSVQPLANFTLTADHRIIDGALAGRFLADLKGALEHPGRLFG